MTNPPRESDGLFDRPFTHATATRRVLSLSAGRFHPVWILGVLFSGTLTLLMLVSIGWVLARGVGVWGINIPVAWGFAITNFVWWIGIGHAGTLISAILLLMRQPWRNSINRFAEAMTLFAIAMAGLFPLLHLGRLARFYYLFPYPNNLGLWPQWRSPLVWDVIAIMTYGIVSLLFWYLGLLPDLATVRDYARRRAARRVAGVLCMGWRGSAAEWNRHHALYFILAAFATPLVVSVHSIVSLDFAVAIVPGWHSTIFPPYFVAGAIFSGMAMVLTITVPLRRAFALDDLITPTHLDAMAKVTLVSGLLVAYGYLMELFTEWYSADPHELHRLTERFAGESAPIFYLMLVCNVLVPQLLWSPRVRRRAAWLLPISIIINIGMWSERYGIVVNSLAFSAYLQPTRQGFVPTFWDYSLLVGSIGCFTLLFLLFIRVVPIIPAHEVRELLRGSDKPRAPEPPSPRVRLHDARSDTVLARFASPGQLLDAARTVREVHGGGIDAFTPNRVEGLAEAVGTNATRIPWVMAAGAIVGAGGTYALQWYAAVVSYPWNVGGRPLHSWPSFLPLTFEIGVLTASLSGFAAFILACRYPRPYHPLSRLASFARSSSDRFHLVLWGIENAESRARLVGLLRSAGAERIDQIRLGAREGDA